MNIGPAGEVVSSARLFNAGVSTESSTPFYLRFWSTIDPEWERPSPGARAFHRDVYGWALWLGVCLLWNAALASLGLYEDSGTEQWKGYLATALMTLPLMVRRRYPLITLLLSTAFFYSLDSLSRSTGLTLFVQVSYLVCLYSAIAWAKNRRMLWLMFAVVGLLATLWVVVYWTMSDSYFTFSSEKQNFGGLFSIPTAFLIAMVLNNVLYFGAAALLGRMAWTRAYQQSVVQEQAQTIRVQSEQMAEDAVMRDRLRIARELHDSVAHHVSVMGVQAAAARRVLRKNPELAEKALLNVEGASRDAVSEMKSVLRVLRSVQDTESAQKDPQIRDIPQLVQRVEDAGFTVRYDCVEHVPQFFDSLSQSTQLSLYRITQESLNNVVKHSTARNIDVVLRSGKDEAKPWVEVEVTDDGVLSSVATGNGFGIRGMKERAEAMNGLLEYGPRQGQEGWKVRVRFPVLVQKVKAEQ